MAEKNNKLDKREYTLMVVPHHGQTVRSIRIPMMAVKYTVVVLFLLMVFMIGSFINYQYTVSTASSEKAELEKFRQNSKNQVQEIADLAKITTALQADMERLNSLDAELRRIVNNEDPANTSRAGLVRPSATQTGQVVSRTQPDINDIKNVVSDLRAAISVREESLIALKQELLAKQGRLMAIPSILPTSGDVTSRFGWRSSPMGSRSEYHPGIDIATSIGTPIVATADGEVMKSSDTGDGYGKMVQIDHGNGIITIYGHNSQLLVQVGQVVKKGQVIAASGNTGYSTGPHCHYEIRINGTAVNPSNFFN